LAPNVTTPNILLTSPASSPRLTIRSTGNNSVQIIWPSTAGSNWVLCCQQELAGSGAWTVVTNSPALVGTNYVVTELCTSTACFYHLEKQ